MFTLKVLPSNTKFFVIDRVEKIEITDRFVLGHREVSAQDEQGNRLVSPKNAQGQKTYAVRRTREQFAVMEMEAHGVKWTGEQVLEMLENLLDQCAREDTGAL